MIQINARKDRYLRMGRKSSLDVRKRNAGQANARQYQKRSENHAPHRHGEKAARERDGPVFPKGKTGRSTSPAEEALRGWLFTCGASAQREHMAFSTPAPVKIDENDLEKQKN